MTVVLTNQILFRHNIEKLLQELVDKTNESGFIEYWVFSTVLSEFSASISIMLVILLRHKIWLDRLTIFPLGLPDSLVVPY